MKDFLQKRAVTIILMLLMLIVGGGSSRLFSVVAPQAGEIPREVMRELMAEVIQEELGPIIEDIHDIQYKIGTLSDNVSEEWVRVMHKQYLKVQTNRDDLSWKDVEYALSKWEILSDNWKTPELEAKIEYLQIKYDEYITNGDS